MPQSNYKDYNNYSQRDKETMRTAAADASVTAEQALVTQPDDIEPKLTTRNTNIAAIKTAEQTIQSNVSSISGDLTTVINLLQELVDASYKIEVNPEELEVGTGSYTAGLSYGRWEEDFMWVAQSQTPDVVVSIDDSMMQMATLRVEVSSPLQQETNIDISIFNDKTTSTVKSLRYKLTPRNI